MFKNTITKGSLLKADISKIKEVFITSSNKRYLEITILYRGKWKTFSLYLKEGLKEQGIKTYFNILKYIDLNYNNDLYLNEMKRGLK